MTFDFKWKINLDVREKMSTLIVIDYQEILQRKRKVYVIIARVIFQNRLREGIFDRKIEIVSFLKDSIVYGSLQILARH